MSGNYISSGEIPVRDWCEPMAYIILRWRGVSHVLAWLLAVITCVGAQTDAPWNTLHSDHFELLFHKEDSRNAELVLKAAEAVYPRIVMAIGEAPKARIRIVLAVTEEEFDRFTNGGVPEWGIGCACPERDLIVLKSPRLTRRQMDLETLVAHEITHVVLAKALPGIHPPLWFHEGVAMYLSFEWRPGRDMALVWAVMTRSTIPLSELEAGYPSRTTLVSLAYTEAFLAVNLMIQMGGGEALRSFIRTLRDTGDLDEAMWEATGLTYRGFQREWEEYVKQQYSPMLLISDRLLFWLPVTVLLIALGILRRYRYRRRVEEMEEETLDQEQDTSDLQKDPFSPL
jgi:hypothetical protein